MGFETFKVSLSSPHQVYFSGQLIKGTVVANVSSVTSCREITVTMIGKGKVQWKESRGKSSRTYSSGEEYGRTSLTLWHGGSSDNLLLHGEHTFPFVFEIPNEMPTSFEAEHGRVYYKIKAVADLPMGIDFTDKVPFQVHHIVDLNADSNAHLPVNIQYEDDAGCFCDRFVSFDMSIDRRGYVPGEKLLINGTVTNNSTSALEYTEAKIIQRTTYHSKYKSKDRERTVQRVYRPGISSGRKDIWYGVPLSIPAVTASDLKYCGIIDVDYVLKFVASFGTCSKLSTEAGLIIGSVPLQRHSSANPSPRSIARHTAVIQPDPAMPSAPMLSVQPYTYEPPPYSEDPPTYEECSSKCGTRQ